MQLQCGQCGFTFEVESIGPAGPVLCPNCGRVMPNPTGASDPVTEVAQALVADDAEAGFAEIAREGLARKMRVICSLCGKHLLVSKFSAGQAIGCPACRSRIRIPEIAADEDVDISRLTSAAAAEADRVSLADALQNRGRRRLRGTSQRVRGSVRKLTAPVAAAAVAACVLALLYLAWSSYRPSPPTRRIPSGPQPESGQVEAAQPAGNPDAPAPPGERRVESPPEPVPPAEPPQPALEVAGPPGCAFVDAGWSVVSSDGRFVAAPGRVFVTVMVRITTGDSAMKFAGAEDATLTVNGEKLPMRGVMGHSDLLIRLGENRSVFVPAKRSETLTFVFEVPEEAGEADLEIRGLPSVSAGRLQPPEPVDADDIPGQYVQRPPADPKPLDGGAVGAALLAAPEHRLVVRSDGEGLTVSIQAAGVSGTARPIRAALYAVQLSIGEDLLSCKLRFIDAGRRAILYLSEEPSDQLIYDRR